MEERIKPSASFIVPPVPKHVQAPAPAATAFIAHEFSNGQSASPAISSAATVPILQAPVKRKAAPAPPPKTPFPDALLPFLADKIAALATGNLTWLIESLYQDLKVHKVKKNSIEAKVREIGEKCVIKKIWVVREDVLVSSG